MCETQRKKTVKEVKMHKFLVYVCKSQDFVQSQKNFARSHNRETVTLRNSGYAIWRRKKYANYISYASLVSFVGLFYFGFCREIFFDIFFFFFSHFICNTILHIPIIRPRLSLHLYLSDNPETTQKYIKIKICTHIVEEDIYVYVVKYVNVCRGFFLNLKRNIREV